MNAIRTASRHPVSHVVFSPDSTTLAVAQPNYGITLHDRATGQTVATIRLPRVAHFSSVIFCDEGRELAVSSRRGLHLFDTATGAKIGHLVGRHDHMGGVLLADRGCSLVAASRAGVREVTIPTQSTKQELWCEPRWLRSDDPIYWASSVSPCGWWGFSVYPRSKPTLIDLGSEEAVAALDGYPPWDPAGPRPVGVFAPTGSRLAVCDGNDVSVYDTADAEPAHEPTQSPLGRRAGGTAVAPRPRLVLRPVFTLPRPEGVPSGERWQPPVAFTPDGRGLLVRRPRNRVQLWDVATGYPVGEWSWRLEWVTCLAVAPDGLTAAAGARFGRVVVWDLE